MTRKSLLGFVFFSMALGATGPARATDVRLDTLGFAGLLPDAQADLDMAGSFIYNIPDRRVFADGDVSRSRGAIADNSPSKTVDSAVQSTLKLEYADGAAAWPFAARVTSSASDFKTKSLTTYDTSHFRTPAGFRGILGLGRGAGWNWALGGSYTAAKLTDNSSSFPGFLTRQSAGTLQFSILTGPAGQPRVAVSIEDNQGRTTTSAPLSPTLARGLNLNESTLNVIPEVPTANGVLRFLASGFYFNSRARGSSTLDYENTYDGTITLGAGWTSRADGDAPLWHTGVRALDEHARQNRGNGITPGVNLLAHVTGATWKASIEDPLSRILVWRASLDLLKYNQSDTSYNVGVQSNQKTYDLLPGFALGFGVHASENVLLDFAFGNVEAIDIKGHSDGFGSVSMNHSSSITLSAAADIKF